MGSTGFCSKHKTAYEMRISDWSSDVCATDLVGQQELVAVPGGHHQSPGAMRWDEEPHAGRGEARLHVSQIGAGEGHPQQARRADLHGGDLDGQEPGWLSTHPLLRHDACVLSLLIGSDPRRAGPSR